MNQKYVQLENVYKSLFKHWKKFQCNGRKIHLRIGKKVQLQNGNNSKCKMKNINKSPITNGNENPTRK